jgi:hypothetical protein
LPDIEPQNKTGNHPQNHLFFRKNRLICQNNSPFPAPYLGLSWRCTATTLAAVLHFHRFTELFPFSPGNNSIPNWQRGRTGPWMDASFVSMTAVKLPVFNPEGSLTLRRDFNHAHYGSFLWNALTPLHRNSNV